MGKIICFDPVTGASGDMILGALFDLGADPERVTEILQSGGFDEFHIHFERKRDDNGIVCGYCDVHVHDHDHGSHDHHHGHEDHDHEDHDHVHGHEDHDHEHSHHHEHSHADGDHDHLHEHTHEDHEHSHEDHGHDHSHDHGHSHEDHDHDHAEASHSHHHRGLADILDIIAGSRASDRAKEWARKIFRRLGEAEASVHGVPVEQIHFHEVGAVDSIVDVFGACIAMDLLGVEKVYSRPFKTGHGTIRCAHGIMPVPAPATAKLLEGFATVSLDIPTELTTPTGAAILTTLTEGDWCGLSARLLMTGMGHGRKEFPNRPNIIRAHLMEVSDSENSGDDSVTITECDMDDQTAEATAYLMEKLLKAGARDVSALSCFMKKGRPGVRLTVVSSPGDASSFASLMLSHGSTIGVRSWQAQRQILARSAISVETQWGEVLCKRIERPSGVEIVPEYESCRVLAEKSNVPLRRIMDAARRWE